MEKVDEESRNRWKNSLDFTNLPTWADCSALLERHCQFLQSIDEAHFFGSNTPSTKTHQSKKASTFTMSKYSCSLCKSTEHFIGVCSQFKALDVTQRFDIVKKSNLCINCLSSQHQVGKCRSTYKCKVCSKPHHSLLHRLQPQQSQIPSTIISDQQLTSRSSANFAVSHSHFKKSSVEQVKLATAVVLIRSANGVYIPARALLDSCSQVSLITDNLSQKLRLTRKKQSIKITGIGDSSTTIKHSISSTLKSMKNDFELPINMCVTSHISHQPDPDIDISYWNIPTNLNSLMSNLINLEELTYSLEPSISLIY